MTTHALRLARDNLKFILLASDLIAIRFTLAVGSLMWVIWGIMAHFYYLITAFSFTNGDHFASIPVWLCVFLFLVHGVGGLVSILLHIRCRWFMILGSMYGVILWTASLILISLVRTQMLDSVLPVGSPHWLAVVMAWWIFVRHLFTSQDCRHYE